MLKELDYDSEFLRDLRGNFIDVVAGVSSESGSTIIINNFFEKRPIQLLKVGIVQWDRFVNLKFLLLKEGKKKRERGK